MKLKKINIILILFLLLTSSLVVGGWMFINSETFSKDLSQKISSILLDKTQVTASFSKVDFIALPPRTIIHDLKLQKTIPGKVDINLELKKVEIDFSLANILSNKLELSSIGLENGFVHIKILDESESNIDYLKINIGKYFQDYQRFLFEVSPVLVDRLEAKNLNLKIDNNAIVVSNFSSSLRKRNLRAKADIKTALICTDKACTQKEEIKNAHANLNWSRENADFLQVKLSHKTGHLEGQINLSNNENGFLTMAGNSKVKADLDPVFKYLQKLLPELGDFKGEAELEAHFDGELKHVFKEVHVRVKNLESSWLDLDELNATITQNKRKLTIKRFEGTKGSEKYRLVKNAEFFDLEKMWFREGKYFVNVSNANSNNFLQAVPSLDPMKITASGVAEVEYSGNKVSFLLNDVKLDELRLQFQDAKNPIIKTKDYVLKNMQVAIDRDFYVYLKGGASDGKNLINIDGKITDKDIQIQVLPNSVLSWNRLGGISGVSIEGGGKTEGRISGPIEDVVFSLNVEWKNFEVVDIHFGEVVGSFDFSLKDLSLGISKLEGLSYGNKYKGHGLLYFGDNSGMDVDLNIENATYSGLIKMIPLIFKDLPMPNFLDFNLNGNVKISGPFETRNMVVKGEMAGSNGVIKGESFDSLSMKFSLQKNLLEFEDILVKKFKAVVSAWATVNLGNGFMEFRGKSAGLYLNDLDFYRNLRLGYQGKLDFDFEGNGTADTLSSKYKLRLSEATIANMSMPGASVVAFFNGKDFTFNGNILGNRIKFESLINFEDKLSNIKFKIDTNEIKDILGIISSHNLNSTKISGRLKGLLDVGFDLKTMKLQKFLLNIQDLLLRKDQMFLRNDPTRSLVSIEDGQVKRWNMRFIGEDETFVDSKGYAQTNGDIRVENGFKLDASIFELLTPHIERSLGFFQGRSSLVIGKGFSVRDLDVQSNKIFIKIKDLKTPLSDISFKMIKSGEDYVLQKLKGILGEGEFKADGKFTFDSLIPKIYLNYQVDKSTLPLFKKTSVTFSSNGELSGNKLPYLLKGKLSILHGESLDDPADFIDDKKINLNIYANYLPQEKGASADEFLTLNMQFDVVNPFAIKNNLAEIYIKGAGVISSSLRSPELNLRLEAVPNVSKFKFKGNDFSLTQGHVDIRDQGKIRQSDVRFIGVTRLNDYDLKLEIAGKVDKVNINLTSDPPLSQEDLLSLLTLGVTNDISKNLDSTDRKFVTTVGLGTLLVDQFKINEDLNSTLGLKLSVLPEFQENETQLIQGKSAISDSSSSRLKSSTKIKLDKKITKQVDLSVSSTVGGSLEQKQEMNLNFNIDRNWSVEGVYELKSSDTDEGNSTNSVGADVKYKWSF